MIETVNVTKIIALTSDKAWQAIAQIGGLERWFPVITDCQVTGCGVGATRLMTLTSGEEIIDRIESIDHQTKRFQYNRIKSPFPVNRYLGTVDICKISPDSSEISWTVEIDVDQEQRDELVGFIKQALADGIDGLERDLLSSTTALQI
ncbi:MAG: SRPBCC family protein [Methylobacter sp.]|nr:SRPBCC family protein [Methylobacter sp.]